MAAAHLHNGRIQNLLRQTRVVYPGGGVAIGMEPDGIVVAGRSLLDP
jgi:hypothetical protein